MNIMDANHVEKMAGSYTLLAAILLFVMHSKVESSPEIMKELSTKFGQYMEDCLKELSLPPSITADFYDYWKPDFVLTNRDTGCVIMCLSKKLGMHQDGELHKENAKDFAKKHGADEAMATQLVDILHACEKAATESDPCLKVMGIANCFKLEVHKLNWAPAPEVLAGELLSDL